MVCLCVKIVLRRVILQHWHSAALAARKARSGTGLLLRLARIQDLSRNAKLVALAELPHSLYKRTRFVYRDEGENNLNRLVGMLFLP